MTDRQEKFCIEFVRCGNATEAYKRAGYEPKSVTAATANSARLIAKDSIRARIAELQEEVNKGKIMDAAERREVLSEIIRSKTESTQDRIRALDVINKMDGMYINKTQLSGADGGPLQFRWENDNA